MACIVAAPTVVLALGQEDDVVVELEPFVVTGSHIARLDLEPVSPVIRISREILDQSGFSTADAVIRSLPMVSGYSVVPADSGGSYAPGASSVNLRGLGNNNTLLLLNGRRTAPYPVPGSDGFQSMVNLGNIPSAAIRNIDVLKDGASAIYGSDAVAGVINVDLVDAYGGFTTEFRIGNTVDTDSLEWGLSVLGGTRSGSMRIVYTVDYRERQSIEGRDLSYTDDADGRSVGSDDLRSSANVSANVFDVDPARFPQFPYGMASFAGIPDAHAYESLPGPETILGVEDFEAVYKPYNYQEETGLFPKERETGFHGRMEYAVGNTLDLYLETSMRRHEREIVSASTPVFFTDENGDGPDGQLVLPSDNPYNPFGADLMDVRWRLRQVGPWTDDVRVDTPRIVAGLKGTISSGWTFDSGVLYTSSEAINLQRKAVFDDLLQKALRGVEIEGEVLYANPFGLSDPRIVDYISGVNRDKDRFELWSLDFKTSGDLVQLGALGTVRMAVGGEYRFEELESDRSNDSESGNIVGGSQSSSISGDRDVASVFTELSVPIYDAIEMQVAGRYESYSDFGDAWKPKIGVRAELFGGLVLRASYGESFRAPDLGYLHSGGSTSFTSVPVLDPLRPDDPPERIRAIGGGNPGLDAEKTESHYFGAVVDFEQFAPVLRGFVLSVDLWRFKQRDVISSIGAAQIVANAGDPFFDRFITRLAPAPGQSIGVISHVSTQWHNLEGQAVQGVDLAGEYRIASERFGKFQIRAEATFVDSFRHQDSFGNRYEWSGSWGQPRWRGRGTLGWEGKDWSTFLFMDYVGAYEDLYYPVDVEPHWRFNPQIVYRGFTDLTFTLGVRNVLNENPPVDTASSITVMPGIHNIEPAFWYMRLRKDW